MVKVRRGAGRAGCLIMLLIVAAIGYFGMNIGEAYWNFYQFQDRMRSEARFAAHRSDAAIRLRIAAFADSLGLPEGARKISIRRSPRTIYIWADYYEHIELPLFVREFHFEPHATGTF